MTRLTNAYEGARKLATEQINNAGTLLKATAKHVGDHPKRVGIATAVGTLAAAVINKNVLPRTITDVKSAHVFQVAGFAAATYVLPEAAKFVKDSLTSFANYVKNLRAKPAQKAEGAAE